MKCYCSECLYNIRKISKCGYESASIFDDIYIDKDGQCNRKNIFIEGRRN